MDYNCTSCLSELIIKIMVCFFHEKACKGTAFFLYIQLKPVIFCIFYSITPHFCAETVFFLCIFVWWCLVGRAILLSKRGGFLTTESHGITRNHRYTNSPSPVGQRSKLSQLTTIYWRFSDCHWGPRKLEIPIFGERRNGGKPNSCASFILQAHFDEGAVAIYCGALSNGWVLAQKIY